MRQCAIDDSRLCAFSFRGCAAVEAVGLWETRSVFQGVWKGAGWGLAWQSAMPRHPESREVVDLGCPEIVDIRQWCGNVTVLTEGRNFPMTIKRLRVFNDPIVYLLVLLLAVAGTARAGVKKHRKPQDPPIKLGTSGANANNLIDAPGSCRSGTLGGLVRSTVHGVQYILSTNGVLALENDGKKGDPVIQPGWVDQAGGSCNPANPGGHLVADLTKFKKLKFGGIKNNKVDAALAEVRDGMVNPKGKIIGIGTPGSHLVAPFVGQQVKKSGRGTGVKRGTVTAVNLATVVEGSSKSPPVRFVKQFLVESNTGKPIVADGDAGAVFFEDAATCPGWVGLTIAMSPDGRLALVNKMSTVLKQLAKVRPKGALEPVGCGSGAAAVVEKRSLHIQRAMRDAERIQRAVQSEVLRLPGVVGMGIGLALDNPEEVVFKVLVEDDTEAIRANIPKWFGKVRCEILKTGRFSAM